MTFLTDPICLFKANFVRRATAHSRPNTGEPPRFEPIARTLLMPRRLHDSVQLYRAPAKALRAAGPPTCCGRVSVGSRHPLRSRPHGPSVAAAGNRPDESTLR